LPKDVENVDDLRLTSRLINRLRPACDQVGFRITTGTELSIDFVVKGDIRSPVTKKAVENSVEGKKELPSVASPLGRRSRVFREILGLGVCASGKGGGASSPFRG